MSFLHIRMVGRSKSSRLLPVMLVIVFSLGTASCVTTLKGIAKAGHESLMNKISNKPDPIFDNPSAVYAYVISRRFLADAQRYTQRTRGIMSNLLRDYASGYRNSETLPLAVRDWLSANPEKTLLEYTNYQEHKDELDPIIKRQFRRFSSLKLSKTEEKKLHSSFYDMLESSTWAGFYSGKTGLALTKLGYMIASRKVDLKTELVVLLNNKQLGITMEDFTEFPQFAFNVISQIDGLVSLANEIIEDENIIDQTQKSKIIAEVEKDAKNDALQSASIANKVIEPGEGGGLSAFISGGASEEAAAFTLFDPNDSDDAKKIQRRLETLGFYTSGVDGKFGRGSRRALRKFKKAKNLGDNDLWNKKTQIALFES